jgi:hypothetical protein
LTDDQKAKAAEKERLRIWSIKNEENRRAYKEMREY